MERPTRPESASKNCLVVDFDAYIEELEKYIDFLEGQLYD